MASNQANVPIEMIEADDPIRIDEALVDAAATVRGDRWVGGATGPA